MDHGNLEGDWIEIKAGTEIGKWGQYQLEAIYRQVPERELYFI